MRQAKWNISAHQPKCCAHKPSTYGREGRPKSQNFEIREFPADVCLVDSNKTLINYNIYRSELCTNQYLYFQLDGSSSRVVVRHWPAVTWPVATMRAHVTRSINSLSRTASRADHGHLQAIWQKRTAEDVRTGGTQRPRPSGINFALLHVFHVLTHSVVAIILGTSPLLFTSIVLPTAQCHTP